ncbi:MAG: Spo0E family sporulation regulatory protein-aspartic acid phosphatase [Clostridia bacterium]|nr:Spo0E family sporulation regulatory protein-aspartic acid phosphatase [Clostridia bacterium]
MLDEINVLREKLEMQILENESYEEVLKTSKQIDVLLVEYYKSLQPAGLTA